MTLVRDAPDLPVGVRLSKRASDRTTSSGVREAIEPAIKDAIERSFAVVRGHES
jgi:hypothetical protein